MKTIKVGDTVNWRGSWGSQAAQRAIVTGIEYCPNGGKYGDAKSEIDAKLKDKCTFDLSNGHWAYGKQIDLLES